jgi:hypothetical protein
MLELGRSRVDSFLSSVVIVKVEQRTQNRERIRRLSPRPYT